MNYIALKVNSMNLSIHVKDISRIVFALSIALVLCIFFLGIKKLIVIRSGLYEDKIIFGNVKLNHIAIAN